MNVVELAIISRVLVKTLCVLYIKVESGTTSSYSSSLKINEENFSQRCLWSIYKFYLFDVISESAINSK